MCTQTFVFPALDKKEEIYQTELIQIESDTYRTLLSFNSTIEKNQNSKHKVQQHLLFRKLVLEAIRGQLTRHGMANRNGVTCFEPWSPGLQYAHFWVKRGLQGPRRDKSMGRVRGVSDGSLCLKLPRNA